MMTAAEIKSLSVAEKMCLMEALWEDFRERIEQSEIPQRHKEILDARRERVRTGEAKLLDWELVKASIGRA